MIYIFKTVFKVTSVSTYHEIMPTSSQNKVLEKVTGKANKKGEVLKPVQMEPVDDLENVWSAGTLDSSSVETAVSHEDSRTPTSQLENPEDEIIGERLHKLGFWNVGQKKDKIGMKALEEKQKLAQEEEAKQYTQTIMEEVEKKISEPPKKKTKNPPEAVPTALCFELKGSVTSHKEVLETMKAVVRYHKGFKIVTIQFLPKARWIINLNSKEARDRLAGMQVNLGRYNVQLRRYDDIMKLEYKKYLRANGLLELVGKAT